MNTPQCGITSETAEIVVCGKLMLVAKLWRHFPNVALHLGFERFLAQVSTTLDQFWSTLVVSMLSVTAVFLRVWRLEQSTLR